MKKEKYILTLLAFGIFNTSNAAYNYIVKNDNVNELIGKYSTIEERFPQYQTPSECELNITSTVYNQLENAFNLNYTKNQWCNLSSLDVSNKNINNLPEALQSLPSLRNINASNNNISSINLTYLNNINTIDLSDNNLTYVPNFNSNITSINLKGNPLDINSFSNISYGNFILDAVSYSNKLSNESTFCQSIDNGNVTLNGTVKIYMCDEAINETDWLAFFSNKCSRTFNSLTEAENYTGYFDCDSRSVTSLPSPGITKFNTFYLHYNGLKDLDGLAYVNSLYDLQAYNNNISDISGLSLLNDATYLRLYNNDISDISSLSNLSDINHLNLRNNKLINLNGLDNLTHVGNLYLDTNNTLEDISSLSNLVSGTVYLNQRHYTTKIPYNSKLCTDYWNSGVTIQGNSYKYQICELSPEDSAKNAIEWLEFLRDKCSRTFQDIDDAESYTGYFDCDSRSITSLPSRGITKFKTFYLQNNGLSNLDGLADVTTLYDLLAYSNNISNINGLSNLENATYLRLYNNNISDLTPLSKLTSINYLHLRNNSFSNVYGLHNLNSVGNLYLDTNSNLTDIKDLGNLSSGTVHLDNKHYQTKAEPDSNFCLNWNNGVTIQGNLYKYQVCKQNIIDSSKNAVAWLEFLRDKCGRTFQDIDEFENYNGESNCSYKSITNLPDSGITKFYTMSLYSNGLTNLNGFADVKNVYDIRAYNNSLSDISGLSNLESATYLRLYNNNISDLTPLSKLNSINYLSLKNNNLITLDGLQNLTSVGNLYLDDNSQLNNISALQNISSGTIHLDNRHYSTKVPYNSILCSKWNNGVNINGNSYKYQICSQSPEDSSKNAVAWLEFLRDKCGRTFQDIDEFENYNGESNCSYKSITNLPDSGITKFYTMSLYSNGLTNLNGLANVTQAYDIRAYNNSLSDISGLSNLESATYLRLYNNNISDLTPLSKLTSINYLHLRNNNLTTLNGLHNLTRVGSLYLDQNTQLNDISSLSNLSSGTVYLDNRVYSVKPSPTSTFCTSSGVSVSGALKTDICS